MALRSDQAGLLGVAAVHLLVATVSHSLLPPASCDHTPLTSGMPAAANWFHTAPQR